MSLGEAFISIRADLRPFAGDLSKNVRPIVSAFEKELNGAVGRAVTNGSEEEGRRTGDRLSRGIKRSMTEQFKKKNAFLAIAASLGGALDDGISALPTEVKAAMVLGLAAVSPLLIGGLGGAVVAGIGGGLAAVGILLASQFQQVQQQATATGRVLREELVNSAKAFGPVILAALGQVETRFRMLGGRFENIFNVSANFVEPLTQGTLNAFEEIVTSINNVIDKFQPFVDELASGFQVIGDAIGDAIEILANMGDDGVVALRDLLVVIGSVIVTAALLVRTFVGIYGIFRKVLIVTGEMVEPFSVIAAVISRLLRLIDEHSNKNKSFINTNTDAADSFDGLITATKGETDALGEYKKAIDDAANSARSNLQLNLDWEDSLDRISEALDKNGKSLDVHTEKGRANIKEFLNGLQVAEERAILRVQRGEQTSEQAAEQYRAEVAQLRALATQAGISGAAFDALFEEIVTTSALKISAEQMGITGLNGELEQSVDAATRLREMLSLIKTLSSAIGKGFVAGFNIQKNADGAIHHLPQIVQVAEAGPEVVIPLTKPARAAQLMQESGLSAMLGGGGPSQIMVFVGNEQLDSRTVRIVERGQKFQARSLSQGPRRF